MASSIPAEVTRVSPFGDLAYRFTVEHWSRLAELAGDNFGARGWLLPNAAWNDNNTSRVAEILSDQRRLAGAAGATAAARAVDRIPLSSAVRQRDAKALQSALAGWTPTRERPASRLE